MRDLQTVDLGDLIPPSIANDPQVQAAVQALNSELQACTSQIEQAILIARIDELDSDTLDQLAWHYNVLFYADGGTLAQKRAAIKRAIYWRRIAGTKAAVEDGIATLQYKPEVIEWWQFGGLPYTFKVIAGVSGQPVTDGVYEQVERIVELTKNTRSHLVGVTIKSDVEGKLFISAAAIAGEECTVYPYNPGAAGVSGKLYYAAAIYTAETVTINPATTGGVYELYASWELDESEPANRLFVRLVDAASEEDPPALAGEVSGLWDYEVTNWYGTPIATGSITGSSEGIYIGSSVNPSNGATGTVTFTVGEVVYTLTIDFAPF